MTPLVVMVAFMNEDRVSNDGVHTSHCCAWHGCKYADEGCPVEEGRLRQEHKCESCSDQYPHMVDAAYLVWQNDFLRYDLLKVSDIPEVLKRAKEFLWMDIDQGAVKRIMSINIARPNLTDEERKFVHLHACALSYARWMRENLFKPAGVRE